MTDLAELPDLPFIAAIARFLALQTAVRELLEARTAAARAWIDAELANDHHAPITAALAPDSDASAALAHLAKTDTLVAFVTAPVRPASWPRWSAPQRRAWLQHMQYALATLPLDARAVLASRMAA